MSDITEDKEFMIEVSVKISVESEDFPDNKAAAIVDKIKTKIFCDRETMTLVGLRTDIYEVYNEED